MASTREDQKHAAGGPGKSAKEGHIDPDKRNTPSQNQRGRAHTANAYMQHIQASP